MGLRIDVDREQVAAFCRRHHIRRLAFFGMHEELSGILGRTVDLNTPQFLSHRFRDRVLADAEVQFAAA